MTSVIARGRRAQLVAAAMAVIDEVGVARASLVQISRRAQISRGVITYHFTSRADLFDAVIEHVYALGRAEVAPDTQSAPTPGSAIAAMVRGSVEFYAAHPHQMRVLSALFAADDPDAADRGTRTEHLDEMARLRTLIHRGRETGEFRDLDVALAAAAVRGALDAMLAQVLAGRDPHLVAAEAEHFILTALRG